MGLVVTDIALTATYDHTSTLVVASEVVQVAPNSQFATVDLSTTCAGYNGASATVTLYGTNDDLAISDTPDSAAWVAIPTASLTNTADGSAYALGNNASTPAVLYVAPSPSTVITNQATTAEAAFDRSVVVPPNALAVGSTLRFRAVIKRVAENGADTSTYHVRLGGTGGAILAVSVAVTAAGFVIIEGEVTVAAAGASGSINGASLAWYRVAQTVGAVNAVPTATPVQAVAIDTTVRQQLVVTTSQSAQSAGNQDQLLTFVVEQIGIGQAPLDVRPYKYLRVSGSVAVAAPTADVTFTGKLNIVRYTPGAVVVGTLTSTWTAVGPVIAPSAAVALAPDATSIGVEVTCACANYNGGSVIAKLQVSQDGTTWHDLPSGSVTFTANGSAFVLGPAGTNALSILGYSYVRVTNVVTGSPLANATLTCRYKIQRQDYPTSS